MVSTKDTPDRAASPMLDTIMVSAIPIMADMTCSTTRGMISFLRSLFENISSRASLTCKYQTILLQSCAFVNRPGAEFFRARGIPLLFQGCQQSQRHPVGDRSRFHLKGVVIRRAAS